MIWERKCRNSANNPKCKKIIIYSTKRNFDTGNKNNTLCRNCSMFGKNNSMYGKRKEETGMWNKQHSKEACIKMGKSKRNIPRSIETKLKISKSTKGIKKQSEEAKQKIGKAVRIRIRKTLEKNLLNGHQIVPFFNSNACKIIEEYGKKNKYDFQHAMNGGEICIDGYYPDGLDKEKKTIIEVDEKHHFDINGNLREKDIRKQQYLENLGYKFIRIKI